ncbi:putative beta-lysine N-acetyltransferase [Alteribacter natronophilus]|uniref:putative beta-lysine N-acetyltransferase n=1 Tax=Alteribacter natronophilus TaxID=2583810 RepID=UPI001486520B|nr:putative beta-lysine N-acetyltransferase [Alteribacter natronophilus]
MKKSWEEDRKNDRLVAYLPDLTDTDLKKLEDDLNSHNRGKWIIYTMNADEPGLLNLGFRQEAVSAGFFNGRKAFIYTMYGKKERGQSETSDENSAVLRRVAEDRKTVQADPVPPYPVTIAETSDLDSLAALYRNVFPRYPTDIFSADALKKAISSNYTFAVMKNNNGVVIGAASAMETGYGSAEITDCAVDPAYRGKMLLHFIVKVLERECKQKGITTVFSITRAKSTGMNMTVGRLGYTYEGTLINNCIISSGFEDMNIWTKSL